MGAMSDLRSDSRKAGDGLRGQILTARFILAIFICPAIGIFLFLGAIREKGFARLTFGDLYPAISITLAGFVYLFLYRFLTRPIEPSDEPPDGEHRNVTGEQEPE